MSNKVAEQDRATDESKQNAERSTSVSTSIELDIISLKSLSTIILTRVNELNSIAQNLQTMVTQKYILEENALHATNEREPTMCALNCVAKRAADSVDGDGDIVEAYGI